MAQNFIECDREQLLLMSPSLREWLPENHLAWFVIDAVKDMDLSALALSGMTQRTPPRGSATSPARRGIT